MTGRGPDVRSPSLRLVTRLAAVEAAAAGFGKLSQMQEVCGTSSVAGNRGRCRALVTGLVSWSVGVGW
jgi:hypothetical protein